MRQRQEALTGVQKMKPSGYFRGFRNIWDFMGLGVVHTVGNSKWNETLSPSRLYLRHLEQGRCTEKAQRLVRAC